MSEIDSGPDEHGKTQGKCDRDINSNYIDLASLDNTWNRLQVRQRDKFTLWGTVDRWGPGAIAILTLLLVACIGWMYSARISAIEADVRHLQESRKDLIDSIELQKLMNQKLREDLLKKGVVD